MTNIKESRIELSTFEIAVLVMLGTTLLIGLGIFLLMLFRPEVKSGEVLVEKGKLSLRVEKHDPPKERIRLARTKVNVLDAYTMRPIDSSEEDTNLN